MRHCPSGPIEPNQKLTVEIISAIDQRPHLRHLRAEDLMSGSYWLSTAAFHP
jgi:hypothetical protein